MEGVKTYASACIPRKNKQLAMSASLQMAECWHAISMATRFFQQQCPSFHGNHCAGSLAPEMLNTELGNRKALNHRFAEGFGRSL